MIIPLSSHNVTLATAGGKGINLARLSRAGFTVPDGFLVSTEAYRAYVSSNHLEAHIQQALEDFAILSDTANDPLALQEASTTIRNAFSTHILQPGLAEALRQAYRDLGKPAVAVRSSATAEDLPEMSFAGQQDTFLNILGEDALLVAVLSCWSSLWTARAIGYRARNGISQRDLALAVVVQRMVYSQASGVLFTANPISGLRSETVIDASLGLGEALVSGQVEPDQYVVNTAAETPIILSKTLGAKSLAIHSKPGGGTTTVQIAASQQQAIPDAAILELARLGMCVQAEYQGAPQDIEWAWADEKLYLLQSRPVTSLYPLPEGMPAEPLTVMVSFGAAQGMLEPMTPFGNDGIQALVVGAARVLGNETSIESQRAFFSAGERIFINVSALLRNRIGRSVLKGALNIAEAGSLPAVFSVWDDPRLAPGKRAIGPKTAMRLLLNLLIPTAGRFVRTLVSPDYVRKISIQAMGTYVERFEAEFADAHTQSERLDIFDRLMKDTPRLMIKIAIPLFAPGLAMLNAMLRLTRDLPERGLAMEVTRGLPYNVTTEMDLKLWEAAQRIDADRLALQLFLEQPAAALARSYLQDRLPHAAQTAIHDFLQHYSMRGVGEIDIGRPRWGEDPTSVIQSLQSYLRINDPERAPDQVFARGAASAEEAVETLASALHRTPGGWLKAHLLRAMAYRVRGLAGLRELPKFTAVRLMGLLRSALLESGHELVEAGTLNQPDDIFFLQLSELKQLSGQPPDSASVAQSPNYSTTIAQRRQRLERERLRRQIPHVLISDGRAFYEGFVPSGENDTEPENSIQGSPVSAGVVEGPVRVVLDPFHAELHPGEILVCPGTDPAWTPLFLAAGGLVMEVGGLMTHGSVVAREYGIPAVVGVSQATQRLKTGMYIRVDGTSGRIKILDEHR
jgi:phosphohistidine swiveling domain-containing protein